MITEIKLMKSKNEWQVGENSVLYGVTVLKCKQHFAKK